jgi:hypothetical protein
MPLSAALARATRCSLVNVQTAEAIECLFNPTELVEKVQVGWNRLTVPGLSHQPLQFQATGNRQLAGVEFYLDRIFAAEQPAAPEVLDFAAFLRALTVPPAAEGGVLAGAPPRVLVVWPEVLVLEAVVTDLAFAFRRFGADGRVLAYVATCTFEEILDARVTSEERRAAV